MRHRLKTPPASEPVTLAEMRQYLGISQSADTARDGMITRRIKTARQWLEKDCLRRAIITQTWQVTGSCFPAYTTFQSPRQKIALVGTLQAVTHIKYVDNEGVQQTLSPALYTVNLADNYCVPAYRLLWPLARAHENSIEIEYLCGYGDAAAVPETIKEAIGFMVGQWEDFQRTLESGIRPGTIPWAATELVRAEIDMRGLLWST